MVVLGGGAVSFEQGTPVGIASDVLSVKRRVEAQRGMCVDAAPHHLNLGPRRGVYSRVPHRTTSIQGESRGSTLLPGGSLALWNHCKPSTRYQTFVESLLWMFTPFCHKEWSGAAWVQHNGEGSTEALNVATHRPATATALNVIPEPLPQKSL